MSQLNVYKRKDGRYEGRIYVGKDKNNKRKYKSYYGTTVEEVQKKYKCSTQSCAHTSCSTPDLTINEISAEWINAMTIRIKESTASNYRMKLYKHIIPAFGSIACSKLNSKIIYLFIEEKLKSGLSARYVSDILILLKSILKYANREYNIKNVIDSIVMPKKIKTEVRLFTAQEQCKLKKHISENLDLTNMGIAISLYTGLRIGELCALQWSDVDFEKRILTVKKTIQRIQKPSGSHKTKLIITEPKSEKSKREIPISDLDIIYSWHWKENRRLGLINLKKLMWIKLRSIVNLGKRCPVFWLSLMSSMNFSLVQMNLAKNLL